MTVRKQADHVRELVQKFKQHPLFAQIGHQMFPEISNELEDCNLCQQPSLLRVHPDMLCYKCWLTTMDAIQQSFIAVSKGMEPVEAERLLEQRLEKLAAV